MGTPLFIYRAGVVADTHVPDRANEIHPGLFPALQAARPDCILHAGDISTLAVLETLEKIAPVEIALGNRDWPLRRKGRGVNRLNLAGVSVALMHGHGSWLNYIVDKWFYIFQGYRFERYRSLLKRAGQGAKVIVFGHTHHPVTIWDDGQLLFNPGSAGFGSQRGKNPSWGILDIFPDGNITASVFALTGYQLVNRQWVRKD